MKLLSWSGFRVVAFDHTKSLLDSGEPQQLQAACEVVSSYIADDMKKATVAGVYGISLGTFFALYCGVKNGIDMIMLNAGLDSFARIVSEQRRLGYISNNFKKNGYDTPELFAAWQPYDLVLSPELFSAKELLVMDSMADDLIDYDAVLKNITAFKAAGAQVELIISKSLGHGQVIVRNCFRIIKTISFFKR